MARDNIAGISPGILKRLFLFPGMVIQWVMYMSVGNTKGYGMVRQQTRLARSPFMTYVYSILAWFCFLILVLNGLGVLNGTIEN